MTKSLILRIDHGGKPLCLYRYDAQDKTCEVHHLNEWDDKLLKSHSQGTTTDLIILVPASWVYHSQTSIASKNTELLAKSIPFAIEEELSNEVEDNYCAFRINEDGTQDVIAIEKTYINQLNEQIKNHQLSVDKIYSEVDWLPLSQEGISVWSDADTSVIKLNESQAMSVATSQISQLLPIFAQDKQHIDCNDSAVTDFGDLPVKESLTAAACCEYLLNHHVINLYVDEIKVKQTVRAAESWQTVKVLVSVLVLSWVVIQGIQWYGLNQSIAETKLQQVNLFKQNYPNAAPSELVDPFAALQSRLKIQNSNLTQDRSMLISAVDKLGQTLQQQQTVKLNGIRMVDQKMELQIEAPTMTVINDFHQLLQQFANSFSVQIGVNELSDDNTFKSIITMVPR